MRGKAWIIMLGCRSISTVATIALAVLPALGAVATETARVHGRVADARGNAIAGFPLRVTETGGRSVELRTQRDGTFSALGLVPGEVIVTLEGATFKSGRAACHVDAGMTASVHFKAIAGNGSFTAPCRLEPPTEDVYTLR